MIVSHFFCFYLIDSLHSYECIYCSVVHDSVVQSRSCLYVVFWKVCGDAGQAMRARHSECSVVIGQNETQQTTSQQHQQHQSQQQQQPAQKPGTEKSTEVGSRLSNGSLDLAEQDSAVRVIDLQATLDKQVRISITITTESD